VPWIYLLYHRERRLSPPGVEGMPARRTAFRIEVGIRGRLSWGSAVQTRRNVAQTPAGGVDSRWVDMARSTAAAKGGGFSAQPPDIGILRRRQAFVPACVTRPRRGRSLL
jgi:hypothetical protein